ncbi:sulfatase [Salinicola halimionae]|uniref:sulfatase n=1 Tax=Salinicola halimionae TaxID=1949081 RepID=UPI000DA1C2AD|nr:sulfatase [Salinicola halimionae]
MFSQFRTPRGHLLLALVLLDILLLTPELPWAGLPPRHWIALEAPLIIGLMALLPPARWRHWVAGLIAILVLTVVLGAAGDALTQTMQGRSLNLYTDLKLVPVLIELIVTNLGLPLAIGGLLVVGLALFALGLVLTRLLQGFHARNTSRGLALLLILVGGVGLARIDTLHDDDAPGWMARIGHPAASFVTFEWQRARETRQALTTFGRQLYNDNHAYAAPGGQPLPGLANTDVILGFIESYGVAAIEREPFRTEIQPRLEIVESQLAAAGLAVVTGRVTAATLGGQSWLNHATFTSGLPVTSQLRFELMINSQHSTMIDDFKATGHDTVAIMPGITRNWPEGSLYGYDQIHTSDSMDYQGPSMGWANMPDQFTWQRVEDYVLSRHQGPTFTELATLSSHAPWSPIIDMIDDWSTIRDGRVFDRWQVAGEDYASLWQDTEAMRRNYGPAIDYALQAASGFARRYFGKDNLGKDGLDPDHQRDHTLMMVLGDHQAAPAIIGNTPGRDVPMHIISDDPALLQGFLDQGFRSGMFPPGPEAAIPMQSMRGLLHRIYGAVTPDVTATTSDSGS